jgi:hypothetical protein
MPNIASCLFGVATLAASVLSLSHLTCAVEKPPSKATTPPPVARPRPRLAARPAKKRGYTYTAGKPCKVTPTEGKIITRRSPDGKADEIGCGNVAEGGQAAAIIRPSTKKDCEGNECHGQFEFYGPNGRLHKPGVQVDNIREVFLVKSRFIYWEGDLSSSTQFGVIDAVTGKTFDDNGFDTDLKYSRMFYTKSVDVGQSGKRGKVLFCVDLRTFKKHRLTDLPKFANPDQTAIEWKGRGKILVKGLLKKDNKPYERIFSCPPPTR